MEEKVMFMEHFSSKFHRDIVRTNGFRDSMKFQYILNDLASTAKDS